MAGKVLDEVSEEDLGVIIDKDLKFHFNTVQWWIRQITQFHQFVHWCFAKL